jgi:predicted outer membrane repeat protein
MGAIPYEQTYTPLPAGDLSGTLTCAGSPYYVQGDLDVPSGNELVLEPCVYLVFRGDYKLNVHGRLLAVGTEENKIGFMPSDTVEGWQGIRFLNLNSNGQDSSRLVHCRILYGNANGYNIDAHGGGIYANQSSSIHISDCYFSKNKAVDRGGALYLTSNSSPLIRNCIFTKNQAITGGAIGCYDNVNAPIKNCQIFNNSAQNGGGISMEACGPYFYGTSIRKNYATSFGGGLYRSGGQVPIFMETSPSDVYDNYAELAGLDFYSASDVYVPPVTEVFLDTASVA